MDKDPENTSGAEPSKPPPTGKMAPRSEFLPMRKDEDAASDASEKAPKANRLKDVLSFRKTGTQPKHLFASTEAPGTFQPSPPPPQEPSAEEKQWVEKVETFTRTFLDSLGEKCVSHPRLEKFFRNLRHRLIEAKGIRRILANRFITQFLPPMDMEWTWKKFFFTRGFERLFFVLLLLFISSAFYTCGERNSEQKRHRVLMVSSSGPDFETKIDTFQKFLTLRNQGKFASAYDQLASLQGAAGVGGIDRHLGETLVMLGQPDKAQTYLEDAIGKNESASDAHAILATIAYSFPSSLISIVPPIQLAENHFKKSIEKDPSNPTAYILWGTYLQNQGKYEEALKRFEQSQRAEGNRAPEKLRDIYIELCKYKLKQPTITDQNNASYYFVQALLDFDTKSPNPAMENLVKAYGHTTPEIFKAVISTPLFMDYVGDPKMKSLLYGRISEAQSSPTPSATPQ